MMRAMAPDAGQHGVRVNAVNPTLTNTGMIEEMLSDPALVARFRKRIPLGAPEDADHIPR